MSIIYILNMQVFFLFFFKSDLNPKLFWDWDILLGNFILHVEFYDEIIHVISTVNQVYLAVMEVNQLFIVSHLLD